MNQRTFLTYDQLTKLSRRDLKGRINDCLRWAAESGNMDDRSVLLSEADFYTTQMDRRHDSWISTRDLILELVVIALIAWEIFMGYHQERHQDDSFKQEQTIWSAMERNSDATAKELETTAKTLGSLENTTELMNGAVQTQLGILYEVDVVTTFDNDTKRIGITNIGHTPITLLGNQFWDSAPLMEPDKPRVVEPGVNYSVDGTAYYNSMSERIAKLGDGEAVPWVIYVRNEAGKDITIQTLLAGRWEKDVLVVRTQLVSIREGPPPNQHRTQKRGSSTNTANP